MQERLGQGASISTSGRLFNQWIDRSRADLALLTTSLPTGPYPYAGIPWFATQFGRDAIITALQTLWLNPQLAAGVLSFLASTQATEDSAFRDSQPGKIMHETRRGEMAALQEVPFGRYYGGVDTTPLFVMLAGAYESRTGDRALVDRIWDALVAATGWIERRLAASPTGFLDYARGENTGLVNQAWKDSHDSMFHDDGRFPEGAARCRRSAGLRVRGAASACRSSRPGAATKRAAPHGCARRKRLRAAIEERFWVPQMHYYAIALDGDGAPCRVYASNAGHLLYCGVPSEERAALVAAQLMSDALLQRLGHPDAGRARAALQPDVVSQRLDLAARHVAVRGRHLALRRSRQRRADPQRHLRDREPVRHAPARAVLRLSARRGPGPGALSGRVPAAGVVSGSVFLLLQACLGIQVDGEGKEVHVTRPLLPIGVESLAIPAADRRRNDRPGFPPHRR